MDEKRLKEIGDELKSGWPTSLASEDVVGLIKLSHLGLWAEKYGVPALKFECGNRCAEQNPCNAKDALAALPKGDEL